MDRRFSKHKPQIHSLRESQRNIFNFLDFKKKFLCITKLNKSAGIPNIAQGKITTNNIEKILA